MKKSTGKKEHDGFRSPLFSNGTEHMDIKRPTTTEVGGPTGGKSVPDPLGILSKHD